MKSSKIYLCFLFMSVSMIWQTSCKKDISINSEIGKLQANNSMLKEENGFAENDMVMYWNEKASVVLGGPFFTPPAQSRYFAIVQIAVHDALNAIKPKYKRFALNERQQFASPDAAVASAAYWTIKGLGIQQSHLIDNWYEESLVMIPNGEAKDQGKLLGKKSADAIIANRGGDNFIQANAQIPLPDGINAGAYRSTLPFSNLGMPKIKALHQWGTLMKPFSVQSNDQFRPSAPYSVNYVAYEMDYNEVKTKGGRIGHTRSADEDEIGKFWVERSSIGWNRFARNMVQAKKLDAWKTARLFALLHTAMTDGVSGCFEAKYYYSYWRPETAIRLGNDDGNQNTTGDPNWLPSYTEGENLNNPALNVYTPPIPDYPSAHANFGGAAGEILKLFFETNEISVNQTSNTAPGVNRHYSTITKAIRDNSLSRIYVGFHFRLACIKGEEQGVQIARYVFNHSFQNAE